MILGFFSILESSYTLRMDVSFSALLKDNTHTVSLFGTHGFICKKQVSQHVYEHMFDQCLNYTKSFGKGGGGGDFLLNAIVCNPVL